MSTGFLRSFSTAVVLLLSSMSASVFADEQVREQCAVGEKGGSATAAPLSSIQHEQRLGDVKKIFVASLGASEDSEMLRQNIINRLIESGVFTVVDSADDADATLVGAAQVRSYYSWSANSSGNYGLINGIGSGNSYGHGAGQTQYVSGAAVRLVSKSKQVLWTYSTHAERLPGMRKRYRRSDLVSSLQEAIQKDRERNQIGYAR